MSLAPTKLIVVANIKIEDWTAAEPLRFPNHKFAS